jgi:hypothetical protein
MKSAVTTSVHICPIPSTTDILPFEKHLSNSRIRHTPCSGLKHHSCTHFSDTGSLLESCMRELSVCGRIIPVYKPEYKATPSSALEYDSADCTLHLAVEVHGRNNMSSCSHLSPNHVCSFNTRPFFVKFVEIQYES